MTSLKRDDLNSALERAQSQFPAPPDLESRVLENAMKSPSQPSRNLGPVLAAAAIAIVLVAGLLVAGRSIKLANRSVPGTATPTPTPAASPAPTPSAAEPDYGPVPAGVAVFYAVDPRNPSWLVAFDWTGRPVGTLKLDGAVLDESGSTYGPMVSAAPNGDFVFVFDHFVRRDGTSAGSFTPPSKSFIWADDGRHLCGVREQRLAGGGVAHRLWTAEPGSAPKDVASIGSPTGDQTGFEVGGCSYRKDLAAVVETASIGYPQQVWYVRLSDGAVVGGRTYPANYLSGLVFAPDLSVVAENRFWAPAPPGAAPAHPTIIRRVSDGAVLQTRDDSVVALSDGGTLFAAAVPNGYAEGVFETASGHPIWPQGVNSAVVKYATRIGAAEFVAMAIDSTRDCGGCMQMVIVRADGSTTNIPGSYVPI